MSEETVPAAEATTKLSECVWDDHDMELFDTANRVRDADDPFAEALAWKDRSDFLAACGPVTFPEGTTLDSHEEYFKNRLNDAHWLKHNHMLGSAQELLFKQELHELVAIVALLAMAREALILRREELAAAVQEHALKQPVRGEQPPVATPSETGPLRHTS